MKIRKKLTRSFLEKEAKKYASRNKLKQGNSLVYYECIRLGLLNDFFGYVKGMKRWTKSILEEEAKKYTTRIEFERNNRLAYVACCRYGILNEVCSHMTSRYDKYRKDINFSTIFLENEAKRYKSRIAFNKNNPPAYRACKRLGILDKLLPVHPVRGYTTGRRLTDIFLKNEAKKYRSKVEFQEKDPSAYTTCRRRGILDEACSHMIPLSFSIPQLIARQLFDILFEEKCKYNDRRAIAPYELDLFYPSLRFAVEYHGKGWHCSDVACKRDEQKKKICKKMGINILVIKENSREYENDIKSQTIASLVFINDSVKKDINSQYIKDITIDYDSIYSLCGYDLNVIESHIQTCSSVSEFQKKYVSEYRVLRKIGKSNLLDPLRKVFSRQHFTDDELICKCKNINVYSELIKNFNWLYNQCLKRDIIDKATSHMKRGRPKNLTEQDVRQAASTFSRRVDFKNNCPSAYRFALKKGIMEELFL